MSKQPINGEQTLMVCVRIRPMNEDEILSGATVIAHKLDDPVVVLLDPLEDPDDVLRVNRSRERHYVFDNALDASSTQDDVYQCTTRFLIDNVIRGYNATVFAYGATGTGKTYTMLGTDEEPGVMFRAMDDLFYEMEQSSDVHAYDVGMSYLEIYNEMIRDLLNPSSGYLELREDPKGVQVAGLSEVKAISTAQVMDMLKRGNLMRTTEPTAANQTSSRSHAVLQITVRQKSRVANMQEEIRLGKLYLIDLAGSERASNTLNTGKRMLEGAHINRSLLALGNCINALADPNGAKRYINYRDSKLTRLLKDALGGNCKTVMIAHISPASFHFEESRNTLVYADRAKNIKTKVRRNVVDVNYHIAQYSNIIAELRQEIFRLRSKLQDANLTSDKSKVHQSKRNELNALKEQLLTSFHEQMELRKNIMELAGTLMEITLDTTRCTLVISEWESEKMFHVSKKEGRPTDSKIKDQEKLAELQGLDHLSDPDDVVSAKEELTVLAEEQNRVEKLKQQLEKDLLNSKFRTKKMEEILPNKISSEEHKEILSLLCRVHEMEIENTELQTENLLKEHEIRKRELVIVQFRNHRELCDEIIGHQKQLMAANSLEPSKELDALMDLYQQEMNSEASQQIIKGEYSSQKEMEAFSSTKSDGISLDDDERIFSRSRKTQQIQEQKQREENNKSNSRESGFDVANNTKGIAALAAERRNRLKKENGRGSAVINNHGSRHMSIHSNGGRFDKTARYNSPWSNLDWDQGAPTHDTRVTNSPDRSSVLTDPAGTFKPGFSTKINYPFSYHLDGSLNADKRKLRRETVVLSSKNSDVLQLNSTNPHKASGLKPKSYLNNRRNKKNNGYTVIHEARGNYQELETASQHSSMVYQIGSEKGPGLSLQKSVRGPADRSTNRVKEINKPANKRQPPRKQPAQKVEPGSFVQPMAML